MSFKHGKFSDSAVLRSLEKIAFEKGLVKEEKITKSAEQLVAERDLSSSNNLSQDIIKLCAGLRRSGLNKHAEEVERNYVNYKRAQTLYEVSKEKGEDLVDFAHPEGGHVLDDVEGKHKVMTILERQQAMKKVVNKEPTGKLSVAQAIRAVKNIFAADPVDKRKMTKHEYLDFLRKDLSKTVSQITYQALGVYNFVEPLLTGQNDNDAMKATATEVASKPTIANLNKLLANVSAARAEASPTWYGGLNAEDWSVASGQYSTLTATINSAIQKIKDIDEVTASGEVPDTATVAIKPEELESRIETQKAEKQKVREQARAKKKFETEEQRQDKLEEGDFSVATDQELTSTYRDVPAAQEEWKKRNINKRKGDLNAAYKGSTGLKNADAVIRELNLYKNSPDIINPDYQKYKSARLKWLDGKISQVNSAKSGASSQLESYKEMIDGDTTNEEFNKIFQDSRTISNESSNLMMTSASVKSALEKFKGTIANENSKIDATKKA